MQFPEGSPGYLAELLAVGRVDPAVVGELHRERPGINAGPDALERITDAILAGQIAVPVAAVFPVEQIRDAVALQAGRHVHGKVVVTL